MERWALHRRRAAVVRLSVSPDNRHAIALYRRHGFVDTGELGELMPGGVQRERVMSKTIRPADA